MFQGPCPKNAIIYNKTLCSCSPGYLFNASTNCCSLFSVSPSEWVKSSVVKHSDVDEDYQKVVRYDTIFLVISLIGLLTWLLACALVRFGQLGDGRNAWFQIRWWITRLDVTFSTKHWLADQTVVKKRKTELGGTFSVASWILFFGLLIALLYQIISKKGTEVYGLKATNAPDLISFTNDLELNITTISDMTCSQLRGLDSMAVDSVGSVDYSIVPLSTFAKYSCFNSSKGPVITLRCQNCPLTYDRLYISWHFVDIENKLPAKAVGFQFNFTAKNSMNDQHYVNYVGGTIKHAKASDDTRIAYRGEHTNLLKFNLFPRVYLNLNGLKLLQPLFHEFRPGSSARDENQLRSLLQSSENGLINITLALNFLTTFLIEIDNQKYAGPVSLLADVGGLYCLSIAIFLLLLSLCESRIKRLRTEDQIMQKIRKRRIAVDHWKKLRKHVAYTYGCRLLNEDYNNSKKSTCCIRGNGSVHRARQQEADLQALSFLKQNSSVGKKVLRDTSGLIKGDEISHVIAKGTSSQASLQREHDIPSLPLLHEMKDGLTVDVSDLRKELQNLCEYNVVLRERLVHAESMLDALTRENSVAKSNTNSNSEAQL